MTGLACMLLRPWRHLVRVTGLLLLTCSLSPSLATEPGLSQPPSLGGSAKPACPPCVESTVDSRGLAMLNFSARRVDPELVLALSRNLREAFMLDGRFDMLDEPAMYDTLAGADGPARLRQARVLLSDGKKAFRSGKLEEARLKLEEARAIHRSLRSELSHSDELADLLLHQGLVLFNQKKPDSARVAFLQMLFLQPGFSTERMPQLSPEARRLIEEARAQERQAPLRGVSSAYATDLARALKVAHVLTGTVEVPEGSVQGRPVVTLTVMAPGKADPSLKLYFELDDSGLVPPAGSALYSRMVNACARLLRPVS